MTSTLFFGVERNRRVIGATFVDEDGEDHMILLVFPQEGDVETKHECWAAGLRAFGLELLTRGRFTFTPYALLTNDPTYVHEQYLRKFEFAPKL